MGDANAVEPTVDRSTAGFDEFVCEFSPSFLRTALAATRDLPAAEDLVQDSLVAAFRSWEEVSGLERPDLWVRRVLINRSVDLARRQHRYAALLPELRRGRHASVLGETVAYWEAVAALPRQRANVVTLRSAAELTTAEIAEVLEIPDSTVRWHLSEARKALRARLGLERAHGGADGSRAGCEPDARESSGRGLTDRERHGS